MFSFCKKSRFTVFVFLKIRFSSFCFQADDVFTDLFCFQADHVFTVFVLFSSRSGVYCFCFVFKQIMCLLFLLYFRVDQVYAVFVLFSSRSCVYLFDTNVGSMAPLKKQTKVSNI